MQPVHRSRLIPALLLVLLAGCGTSQAPPAAGDDKVKAAFEAVQQALKARDADKLWDLLDSDTQADAERAAKAWQEAYAKADAEKIKKDIGITAEELAKLNGKSFLKTEPFHDKEMVELTQSKLDQVKVDGAKARVEYIEPDGDREKLNFVQQGGQWKVRLPMPKPKS